MTAVNRTTLYSYFLTGSRPTQQQFANLIDSNLNIASSAAQTVNSDVSALGSFAVSGAFEARGAATFKSDVNVSGNLSVGGAFSTGSQTIAALTVAGQSILNGATISGTTSAQDINAAGNIKAATLNIVSQTTLGSAATTVTPPVGDKSNAIPNTAWINPDSNLIANGSRKNPDGSIEKWGTSGSINTVTTAAVTYASAFPTACWSVTITSRAAGSVGQSHDYVASAGLGNFDLFNASNATATFFYRAIGN